MNTLSNTNRWSTRQLAMMACLIAVGAVLHLIEFSILPSAPFLKLDLALVAVLIAGLAFGPVAGLTVGLLQSIIAIGIIHANPTGMVMDIIAIVAFILPVSIIYKKFKSPKSLIIGLVVSVVSLLVFMTVGNLIVTPLYMNVPLEVVIGMLLPAILPFNLIKGVVIAVVGGLVFAPLKNMIVGTKKDLAKE